MHFQKHLGYNWYVISKGSNTHHHHFIEIVILQLLLCSFVLQGSPAYSPVVSRVLSVDALLGCPADKPIQCIEDGRCCPVNYRWWSFSTRPSNMRKVYVAFFLFSNFFAFKFLEPLTYVLMNSRRNIRKWP